MAPFFSKDDFSQHLQKVAELENRVSHFVEIKAMNETMGAKTVRGLCGNLNAEETGS